MRENASILRVRAEVSSASEHYVPRFVDSLLDSLSAQLPAVMVKGPRATGKTTTSAAGPRLSSAQCRQHRPWRLRPIRMPRCAASRSPCCSTNGRRRPGAGAVRRAVDADSRRTGSCSRGPCEPKHDHEVWPARDGSSRRRCTRCRSASERRSPSAMFLDNWSRVTSSGCPPETPDLRGYVDRARRRLSTAALKLSGAALGPGSTAISRTCLRTTRVLEQPATTRRDSQRLRRYFEAYALDLAGMPTTRRFSTPPGSPDHRASLRGPA